MRYLLILVSLFGAGSFAAVTQVTPFADLKATDGKSYGLETALKSNKAAVVVFIATECPFSNKYNARYEKLAKTLKAKNVAFLPINSNDTEPLTKVSEHAKEHKFSFPVLKDEAHKIADAFQAEKTPEAFLIGKDRSVLYHGRIDDDTEGTSKNPSQDLLAAVDQHLANKPIQVKETKAFGCTIKKN
jgi:peroxiredoxin